MNNEPLLAGRSLDGRSGHEVGRELLAELYFQKTGQPLPPIRTAKYGKPYFENSPFYFSISHTKRHAFCVLAENPVGIDAEETDRPVNLQLSQKILSPAEQKLYDAAPDKRAALLRFWVLKEAAAKLSGTGLQGYPKYTNFSPDDPRIRQMDGCFVAVLEEKL